MQAILQHQGNFPRTTASDAIHAWARRWLRFPLPKRVGAPFLLFVPGIKSLAQPERFTTVYDFPRGALSLATFVEAHGFAAKVIPLDFYISASRDQDEIDRQLGKVIEDAVREYKPSVVGVSAAYSLLYPTSLAVLELCKAIDPTLSCGIGGTHVSYLDEQTFVDCEAVDWVVRGEGEWALLDLLRALKTGSDLADVRNLTYRLGDQVIVNPMRDKGDLEELPPLDYELLPRRFVETMSVSIVASRGCAYKCTYCNESKFWGQDVRRRAVSVVADEIRSLVTRYGNRAVGLEDSMFDMHHPHFFELMKQLEGVELNPSFYILSRVDTVTPDGFAAMKRAGIKNLVVGIESASPVVLKKMGKRIDMFQAMTALRAARKADLTVGSFWIIGHPGDTPVEADTSLEALQRFYAEGIVHNSEIAMFIPYPGTVIFERPAQFGVRILTHDWERWGRFNTDPISELDDFRRADILKKWQQGMQLAQLWQTRRTMGLVPIAGVADENTLRYPKTKRRLRAD